MTIEIGPCVSEPRLAVASRRLPRKGSPSLRLDQAVGLAITAPRSAHRHRPLPPPELRQDGGSGPGCSWLDQELPAAIVSTQKGVAVQVVVAQGVSE